ncbi:hypothetical protein PISL3812_09289 [Talaromyces islandicus]|uniref:Uncharacterized protein n=1 Tax=Talaromyces islandicus TaxID=28573 RepID=A0A0U1MAB3_TALIS|nr:hypothetical protein PISL3812_09289 [Talaromyces islandicus]
MRLEVSSPSCHSPSPSSAPTANTTTARNMIALATSATPSVTQNTTITKRPKLSLQTTSLPLTFGTSTTGLARTCATASPTVRNTFNNAYEATRPLSTIDSPSPCRPSNSKGPRYASPYAHHYRTSDTPPYQQPLGVRSILQNSPLKKLSVRRQSVTMSAGALAENRRVLFPVKKQVSFHCQLEEEIRTVQYVARHSDLDSDHESEPEPESESDNSSDSTGSHSDSHSSSGEDDGDSKNPLPQRKRRKSIPSERQIRAAALRDGLSEDHYAASLTAVSQTGRSKRRCKWRWTLGENATDSEHESVPSAE